MQVSGRLLNPGVLMTAPCWGRPGRQVPDGARGGVLGQPGMQGLQQRRVTTRLKQRPSLLRLVDVFCCLPMRREGDGLYVFCLY